MFPNLMSGLFLLLGLLLFFAGFRLFPLMLYGVCTYAVWYCLSLIPMALDVWIKAIGSIILGFILGTALNLLKRISAFCLGFLTGYFLFTSLHLINPDTTLFYVIRLVFSLFLGITIIKTLPFVLIGLTGFWGSYLLLSPFGYEKNLYALIGLSLASFVFQSLWRRRREKKHC
jgi:hypothetical protein